MLAAADLADGFAVINPGAGWPSKLWPPERFAAVARYLGHDRGLASLVVWAGPEEQAWAEMIVAGLGRPCPAGAADFACRARRAGAPGAAFGGQ